MTRRKLVALVGAITLLTLGLIVAMTGLFVFKTTSGRAKLRDFIVPLVASHVHGSLYVGALSGSFIGGVTIDSLAIRDKRGELFVSTGPVTVEWNWRDLVDNRVKLTRANVEHPYVHLIQHTDYGWNYREIFATAPDNKPPSPAASNARNFGDYIVLDSTTMRNVTLLLTMPWHPDDTLHGAVRDSVIKDQLAKPERAIVKTYDGYARVYAWRNGGGLLTHVRIADPDSDKAFGKQFVVGRLDVDEYEPTFQFRNVRAVAQLKGDSIWFQIPHFDMPASTGKGSGKVWWGSDLPVRYDIAIHGDSVSLNDVNWVYPTLPHTGGGTLDLAIKNDPKDLQVVDFRLQNMNVRSTGSHLTGDMWFGTGAPLLLVRNVDVKADPVDFELLKTLAGKPFPEDWRGQIFGTVHARGGPLTHFYVDDARGYFNDAHVRGAVSRFSAKGELDILLPAFTVFHGFDVNVPQLDLRTVEYLFPNFPKIGGFASGTATLDSSWLDVRFSNAHIALQDGPGEPTRASGSGRITYGDLMTYDLALDAAPLNLTMLQRSFPFENLPARGLMSGPIRASGTSPNLLVETSLQGENGALSFDGRVDLDSVGGYGVTGHGQFSGLNVPGLLEMPALPRGVISGHYDLALDSIADTRSSIRGSAALDLESTIIDSVRTRPSRARLRFAGGLLIVDSLSVRTDAFDAEAHGAVGLPGVDAIGDSLRFVVTADSLGGLRPLLPRTEEATFGGGARLPDSLSGAMRVSGYASGALDALRVRGALAGSRLYYKSESADSIDVAFNLRNALSAPVGDVAIHADSAVVAGVLLDTIGGRVQLVDSVHRTFVLGIASNNGPTIASGGAWTDSAAAHVIVADSLNLSVGTDRWRLAGPARIAIDSTRTRLDSLQFLNADSAAVSIAANVPEVGPAFARVRATALPLTDMGTLFQLGDTLYGRGDLSLDVSGTKLAPVIDMRATLGAVRWAGMNTDRFDAAAHYQDRRLTADADMVRAGRTTLTAAASWPYDVTLFSFAQRDDSVSATLRADSTELSLIAPLFKPAVDSVRGSIVGQVALTGTTSRPLFNGSVAFRNGSAFVRPLGVTVSGIGGGFSGSLIGSQDSTNVHVWARTGRRDSLDLSGWATNVAAGKGTTRFGVKLAADSIHAFDRRGVADLYLSTHDALGLRSPITLAGTLEAPTLTGSINVDRGSIFLADPDLARKLAVQPLSDDPLGAKRTTTVAATSMLTTLMTNLQIQGVPVTLGQDVRLKSTEADVRLSGQLTLVKSPTSSRVVASTGLDVPGLSLSGQLQTQSGSYNLNLSIVQREFSVLPGGTVTFDGVSPVTTPFVDISANYNVKQFRDRDLGVRVNLKGRLPTPQITFSSTADYEIATSDLLSYLITGAPGFDFGANQRTSQVLATFLSPTISAIAADRLRRSIGAGFDTFQFELGNYALGDQGAFTSRSFTDYLYTATLDVGQRVGNNVYVSLNAGLCDLKTALANGRLTGLGAKVEYRFKPDVSLQAGYEPSSLTRTSCSDAQLQLAQLGLVPTPSQISFSIHHTWRF